ncbi:MAG: cytochrome c peroxidase [Candidatus Binatia bacterium]
MRRVERWWRLGVLVALSAAGCGDSGPPVRIPPPVADAPEVVVGERLFLETRFAEYFFAHAGGQVNAPLNGGDPVLGTSETTGAPLPGPFAGRSMNCRACHLVDELGATVGGGVRTYADFARRSPIPAREDGARLTPRNSPALVNASLPRAGAELFHFDGEFPSLEALVTGTLTGRNYGWLPAEHPIAIAHIAAVVRGDDGRDDIAAETGQLPYRVLLAGTSPRIEPAYRLPAAYRIDVRQADDAAVVEAVSRLIAAYVRSLVFLQNSSGAFVNAPYDLFLRRNGLPRRAAPEESDRDYSRRLAAAVERLEAPRWVTPRDATFRFHRQPFQFGPQELAGLRTFLAEAPRAGGGAGNCAACHPAPAFTDFRFHNTGVTQREYDAAHGPGAFAALDVPDLTARNADPAAYLPPSADYPAASGRFRAPASATRPGDTDLGAWNVLANPSMPAPQEALTASLCDSVGLSAAACTPAALLPLTVAVFKTPGLRDLGQSGPYMHDGSLDAIEDVLDHYVAFAALARRGQVRNAAPELARIDLAPQDRAPLAAFLRALNEDYD